MTTVAPARRALTAIKALGALTVMCLVGFLKGLQDELFGLLSELRGLFGPAWTVGRASVPPRARVPLLVLPFLFAIPPPPFSVGRSVR